MGQGEVLEIIENYDGRLDVTQIREIYIKKFGSISLSSVGASLLSLRANEDVNWEVPINKKAFDYWKKEDEDEME